MKKIFFFFLLCISLKGFSQSDKSSIIQYRNPSSVVPVKGYSHSVEIDLGNCKMIILSGQIALDKNGNLVGKGNVAEQAEQVFVNIKNIVAASGGTMDDVIKINIYMIDISQAQVMRNVRNKFINLVKPPTSILMQVSKLVRDDILIEIEATAIIPKKM